MDLPTCPSCGQSVLDDDAADCPFCGAAMDGSSGAKKQSAAAPSAQKKKRKAEASKPEDDDPFAIKKAPTTGKVIPCARKPMKGRLHRVVCPMCDTQGFIPKKAIGMQVKCANKECLVPVFTATDGKDDDKPRAPTRVSDEELSRPAKDASIGAGKKPLLLYGIVAAVLLAATLGLVYFLNQTPPDEIGGVDMSKFITDDGDDPEQEGVQPKEPETPKLPDFRKQAEDIAASMAKTALISHANRDKAFCRRMTADAFLRLNLSEKADAEFQQMNVVASQDGRDTDYYQIVPRINQYWRDIAAGDQVAAEESLNAAVTLKDNISGSVGIAVESAIALAAAMVHSGDVESAKTVLESHRGDVSVSSHQDSVRYAAWLSVADTLRDQGKTAWPPEAVFFWNDPLTTATAAQLAANGQFKSAITWALAESAPVTISDMLAVSAEFSLSSSSEHQNEVAAAAKAAGPETALRIYSVLAAATPDWFARATEVLTRIDPAEPMGAGTFEEIIDSQTPDLMPSLLAGNAYADFVIAAVAQKNDIAAKDGFDRLYRVMASAIPPTADLRKASRDIKIDSNRIQSEIGEELKLRSDSAIRNKFNEYRRGSDRLARAAETRRLYLIQLLSRIAQRGGSAAVMQTLSAEGSELREEVMIDKLCGMIFSAAAATGQELVELKEPDDELAIAVERVDPVPESEVVSGLVSAWGKYISGGTAKGVAELDGMRALTGLRAATANYMTEQFALAQHPLSDQLAAIRSLRNVRWQERAMRVIAQNAAASGKAEEAKNALDDTSAAPAGRIMYFHGLLTGLLQFEITETARLAAEEASATEN